MRHGVARAARRRTYPRASAHVTVDVGRSARRGGRLGLVCRAHFRMGSASAILRDEGDSARCFAHDLLAVSWCCVVFAMAARTVKRHTCSSTRPESRHSFGLAPWQPGTHGLSAADPRKAQHSVEVKTLLLPVCSFAAARGATGQACVAKRRRARHRASALVTPHRAPGQRHENKGLPADGRESDHSRLTSLVYRQARAPRWEGASMRQVQRPHTDPDESAPTDRANSPSAS